MNLRHIPEQDLLCAGACLYPQVPRLGTCGQMHLTALGRWLASLMTRLRLVGCSRRRSRAGSPGEFMELESPRLMSTATLGWSDGSIGMEFPEVVWYIYLRLRVIA